MLLNKKVLIPILCMDTIFFFKNLIIFSLVCTVQSVISVYFNFNFFIFFTQFQSMFKPSCAQHSIHKVHSRGNSRHAHLTLGLTWLPGNSVVCLSPCSVLCLSHNHSRTRVRLSSHTNTHIHRERARVT